MAKASKSKAIDPRTLVKLLKRYYPDAHCALDHENPEQLLIATILSAQCTDERVNIVTKVLFKKYPDMPSLARGDLSEIEAIVRPTGFKSKAKNIQQTAIRLTNEFSGKVPKDFEAMVTFPGVGRKTANVVMGNAFNIATGVVVDTHVGRLSRRLGLTKFEDAVKVETDLEKLIPKKDWINFSHWLISHGRQVCKARKPQCHICFLDSQCPKRF